MASALATFSRLKRAVGISHRADCIGTCFDTSDLPQGREEKVWMVRKASREFREKIGS